MSIPSLPLRRILPGEVRIAQPYCNKSYCIAEDVQTNRYFFWNRETKETYWDAVDDKDDHVVMTWNVDGANPGIAAWLYLGGRENCDTLIHVDFLHRMVNKERLSSERVPIAWLNKLKTLAVMRFDRSQYGSKKQGQRLRWALKKFETNGDDNHPLFIEFRDKLARDFAVDDSQVRNESRDIFDKMVSILTRHGKDNCVAPKATEMHRWFTHHDAAGRLSKSWHSLLMGAMWLLEEEGFDSIDYLQCMQQRAASTNTDDTDMRAYKDKFGSKNFDVFLSVLATPLCQDLMRSQMIVMQPPRSLASEYMSSIGSKGSLIKLHASFASSWDKLVLVKMVHDSCYDLAKLKFIGIDETSHVTDGHVHFRSDLGDDMHTLRTTHMALLRSALAQYHELAIVEQHPPWSYVMILDPDTRAQGLEHMKAELAFIHALESGSDSQKWAPKAFMTAFQCYRRPLRVLEQCGGRCDKQLIDCVAAYWHDFVVQSVSLEQQFAAITRSAKVSRETNLTTNINQIHAAAVRCLAHAYPDVHQPQLLDSDWTVPLCDKALRTDVFQGEYASDSACGLNLADVTTGKGWTNATWFSLARRHMNLVQALRITTPSTRGLLWTGDLVEAGHVILDQTTTAFYLVLDTPPNVVKVQA